MAHRAHVGISASIAAFATCRPAATHVDTEADLCRGNQMQMLIASAPNGDYDIRARMLARHLGRHIPGNPTLVLSNMPGGVGLAAANYLANAAEERVTTLRRAFDATIKDKDVLAEAAKTQMDISPDIGEECEKVAASMIKALDRMRMRAKAILEGTPQ